MGLAVSYLTHVHTALYMIKDNVNVKCIGRSSRSRNLRLSVPPTVPSVTCCLVHSICHLYISGLWAGLFKLSSHQLSLPRLCYSNEENCKTRNTIFFLIVKKTSNPLLSRFSTDFLHFTLISFLEKGIIYERWVKYEKDPLTGRSSKKIILFLLV